MPPPPRRVLDQLHSFGARAKLPASLPASLARNPDHSDWFRRRSLRLQSPQRLRRSGRLILGRPFVCLARWIATMHTSKATHTQATSSLGSVTVGVVAVSSPGGYRRAGAGQLPRPWPSRRPDRPL